MSATVIDHGNKTFTLSMGESSIYLYRMPGERSPRADFSGAVSPELKKAASRLAAKVWHRCPAA